MNRINRYERWLLMLAMTATAFIPIGGCLSSTLGRVINLVS